MTLTGQIFWTGHGRASGRRSGLTLIELMISVVLTLMLVFAMVQIFDLLGVNVRRSRALLDLSGHLRQVANQLQTDLNGVTLPVRPWTSHEANAGYFEYIEGLGRDGDLGAMYQWTSDPADLTQLAAVNTNMYGDLDDILMFTARSTGEPFVGRVSNQLLIGPQASGYTLVESDLAEVIWWIRRDAQGNATLFRRVLLIVPELGQVMRESPDRESVAVWLRKTQFEVNQARDALTYQLALQLQSDISLRQTVDPRQPDKIFLALNSLSDLSDRANRFAHLPADFAGRVRNQTDDNFPYPVILGWLHPQDINPQARPLSPIISDIVAFDVKAYDPQAPVRTLPTTSPTAPAPPALVPGDPGYTHTDLQTAGTGAFVDLAYARGSTAITSHFSGFPTAASRMFTATTTNYSNLRYYNVLYQTPSQYHVQGARRRPLFAVGYCTWTDAYERDGVNQDRDQWVNPQTQANEPLVDEGRNGWDDDGLMGVDDPAEFETAPPYPHPLRGIEVTLRIWDIQTKQFRQASVVADFLPE